jgi:choice-of-anchor A domain-containing protein
MMTNRLTPANVIFAFLFLFSATLFAQSPTAPALGFNVFLQNDATLINNETEGPVAMGGNLTIGGSYQVSTNQTGTYMVSGVKVTLVVGGKMIYSAGNSLQVNQNGYVKIGDSTGSFVWYKDNNNAYSPIRITPGASYNASPKISLAANSLNLGVSATNNPVFQGNLIDFVAAFTTMKFSATSMSLCADNTVITNPNGTVLTSHTGLPNQVKVNLATGINYLNLNAADMNAVQNFTYNQQPSATRILIVNVNAPGTFNWSVWNSGGIGGTNTPYILYNFYNTTTLNIQGNGAVEGTVFAPYATITKTSNSNIEGQVIAQSYSHNGGENHYFPFTTSIPGCAAAPVASFTINSTPQCISNNAFVFTNTSTGAAGLIYKWTFGDGGTSALLSPSKTYSTAGTYSIKLVVTGPGGSDSTTKTIVVTANASTAGFTVNDSSQFLTDNNFVFTSSGNPSGKTYNWSFGDNTVSADISPAKSYNTSATFVVKQVVTSTGGCKDSISKTVVVKPVSPTVAVFNTNNTAQCISGNLFSFTNASTGNTLSYKWYFGDGEVSENASPSKTYTTAGSYSVKLVVSGLGGKDSISHIVTVFALPQTGFTLSDTAQFISGNSFTFTPISTDPALTYQWHLGDGTFSTAVIPTKSYAAIGSYEIRQVVTSANGCNDSTSQNVVVKSPSLTVASFRTDTSETQCLTNNHFSFVAQATGSGALTYVWSFGDNTVSGLPNPSKTYAVAGIYQVKLVVTGAGGVDSVSHTISVGATPVAGFGINDSSQFVTGNNFMFNTTGDTTGNSFKWVFGDSSFSSEPYPQKTYTAEGVYAVTQMVISDMGCTANTSKFVWVNAVDTTIAAFSVNNSTQCVGGNIFHFTNTSSGSAVLSYTWDFGDGTISSMANPLKTYADSGTYTVKLITEALGGKDSAIQIITVNAATAGFTLTDTVQNILGNQFAFNTDSLPGYQYNWTFGDGTTAAVSSPVKVYAAAGNYVVKQHATSPLGCKDSVSVWVTVDPL